MFPGLLKPRSTGAYSFFRILVQKQGIKRQRDRERKAEEGRTIFEKSRTLCVVSGACPSAKS